MKKYLLLSFMMFLLIPSAVFADFEDSKVIKISLVNQDPDPVIAGDIVEIRFGVENQGGEAANDLMVEIIPEYPFELASGFDAVENVGTIKSYQEDENMKIIDFKLKVSQDAPAGNYEIDVWEYQEGKKNEIRTQRSFDIEIKNRESTEVIFIDKTILIPGEESTMKFTINNVGKAPLRDLKFTWGNDENVVLPVGSGNTKYIQSLDVGESADLNYRVIANTDADPGLYKLDLVLEYDDPITSELKQINDIAGVYVGGSTDFDVAFSENSKGETSFTIANIGSNPAYSISVMVPEQEEWKLRGSSSVMVGNLNTGDYTIAGFNLIPISQKSKIPLDIEIRYTDTTGKRNLLGKNVILEASNINSEDQDSQNSRREKPKLFGIKTFIPILILFTIVTAYMIYRKKKKTAKNKN